MTLKELHYFVFKELGINPKSLHKGGTRLDNIRIKYARVIFCAISKEVGYCTGEVSDYIQRELGSVNLDVRDLKDMGLQDDFMSISIVENYKMILTKVEEL
jgi:hypothetical protein